MDLEIARIKYTRGQLPSSHIPVIATRALVDGYDSDALVLLAGESRPTVATVGHLFEKAMRELGIDLPAAPDETIQVPKGDLSVHCPDFLELTTTRGRTVA